MPVFITQQNQCSAVPHLHPQVLPLLGAAPPAMSHQYIHHCHSEWHYSVPCVEYLSGSKHQVHKMGNLSPDLKRARKWPCSCYVNDLPFQVLWFCTCQWHISSDFAHSISRVRSMVTEICFEILWQTYVCHVSYSHIVLVVG